MRKSILFFLIILSLAAKAQEKTIRGVLIDDYTNYKIPGVVVSPDLYDSITISDEKGKFKIDLPPRYKDTIVFTHTDYYPLVKRLYAGDAVKLNYIRLVPRIFRLDTVCYSAYKENSLVVGEVVDYHKGKPIESAIIRMEDNKIVAYSNQKGQFKAAVPKTNRALIVNHDLFEPKMVPVRLEDKGPFEIKIKLQKSVLTEADTSWKNRNNILLFSVLELFNGGIGLRYERFVKPKHAIGIHATGYFFGVSWPYHFGTMDDNRFHGLKLAPFYHFYVLRTISFAGYAEIKPLIAYFDFYSLDYARDNAPEYEYNTSATFWTGGISAAWGWLFFPRRSNYTIGLSLGFQFMPWKVPDTIIDENGVTWELNKAWWYFGGPGSLLEFKFMLGGIF